QDHAGRILEERHGVEQLSAALLAGALQRFDLDPPRIDAYGVDLGAVSLEQAESVAVTRFFDEDAVSLAHEEARDQIERLLGAVDDDEPLPVRVDSTVRETIREPVAQRRISRGRPIIERARTGGVQHFIQ